MTRKKLGAFALVIGSLIIFALPAGSFGSTSAELKAAREALVKAGQQVQTGLESTVQKTGEGTAGLLKKTKAATQKATTGKSRATATDPPTQPPLHGTNPHGQGTVGVVDADPSSERPLAADPSGRESGEEVVVGRARGEKNADGTYHGHITIAALFGQDLIPPIDTAPGETKTGPAAGAQSSVLDPVCQGTQICLGLFMANSTTTASGSTNDFALAKASLLGLGVGASESQGNIAQDSNCQAAGGAAKTTNVVSSTGTVAGAANSTSTSKSCRGQAPEVANTSEVVNLGGTGVAVPPLVPAGCANGTPDTRAGLPGLVLIICNAEEIAGAAAVREALSVFTLQVGTMSVLKETTAASESLTVAPEAAAQCSDGIDNDGDGLIDAADPGCHSDGNAGNPASYVPTDNDENNPPADAGGSGDDDDKAQCSDGRDNDGDGVTDADDPGCHTDGNANNPDSYDPDDDSEADGGGGAGGGGSGDLDAGALPFTGTDLIGISLAGLLVLAGGLLLRRREDLRTVR